METVIREPIGTAAEELAGETLEPEKVKAFLIFKHPTAPNYFC